MLVKTKLQNLLLSVLKCEPCVSRYCILQQDCTQYNSTSELQTHRLTRMWVGIKEQ